MPRIGTRSASLRSYTSKSLGSYDSLATFVKFTNSGTVDQTHITYQGQLYEYCCHEYLKSNWGIEQLAVTGASGDNGIDLKGTWPSSKKKSRKQNKAKLQLIVQCKSSKRSGGTSAIIRELVGTIDLHSYESNPCIGVLFTPSEISPSALKNFQQSKKPLIYVRMEQTAPIYSPTDGSFEFPKIDDGSAILKIIQNKAAKTLLLDSAINLPTPPSALSD